MTTVWMKPCIDAAMPLLLGNRSKVNKVMLGVAKDIPIVKIMMGSTTQGSTGAKKALYDKFRAAPPIITRNPKATVLLGENRPANCPASGPLIQI